MKRILKPIYGMARVGYSSGYEIYVNTNDGGNIPHFHYRDQDDWSKFHCCIRLDSASYFEHTGEEDKLNSKQRKDLVKFLNSKVSIKKYSHLFNNNWELICFLWDLNNSNVYVSDDIVMPNYFDLPII